MTLAAGAPRRLQDGGLAASLGAGALVGGRQSANRNSRYSEF
jgi:hypothetical protein